MLPDPLAAFVEAAGQLAASSLERGDRAAARRALEDALRAVDTAGMGPALRVVR